MGGNTRESVGSGLMPWGGLALFLGSLAAGVVVAVVPGRIPGRSAILLGACVLAALLAALHVLSRLVFIDEADRIAGRPGARRRLRFVPIPRGWHERERRRTERHALDALRESTGACPLCQGALVGHKVGDLTMGVLGSPRLDEIVRLIEARHWREAVARVEADVTRTMLVWRAVKCPRRDGMALVAIVSTEGLWGGDRPLSATKVLSAAEARELEALVPWTAL